VGAVVADVEGLVSGRRRRRPTGSEREAGAQARALARQKRGLERAHHEELLAVERNHEEQLRQLRTGHREKLASARRTQREAAAELRATTARLRAETRRANREARRAEKLEAQLAVVRAENVELRAKLEAAQRAGKRQAGPFSKGEPKENPSRPGRKKGARYGKRGKRPRPAKVDEVHEASLPASCPDCGGAVTETAVHEQFVVDVPPVQPHTTQFNVHVGCCERCGKRVQGRHPLQHSDALGAAAVQIGPMAVALAANLNKVVGASYVKIAHFFLAAWAIGVTPSTLTRAIMRLAKKGEPSYEQIAEAIRRSRAVYPDETGWKVGGYKAWLWVFVGEDATYYTIEFSRGFEVARALLGEDWDGVLGHDGWAPYDKFCDALHQQCLNHLIRRCDEILETAKGSAVRFPRAIKAILQDALALRDQHEAKQITDHGLLSAVGKLAQRVARELARALTYEPNRVFAKHLRKHQEQLFTFLRLRVTLELKVEGTNWPAEQEIRPAVVNRKTVAGTVPPTAAGRRPS
jgi:transposase